MGERRTARRRGDGRGMRRAGPAALATVAAAIWAFTPTGAALAQGADPLAPDVEAPADERSAVLDMTLERLGVLILRLDETASATGATWRFQIEDTPVLMVSDPSANRMRLMTPIKPATDLSREELFRLSQANFDTALDVRYAIARNILWATYIHPLRELRDGQFLEAIGQTVNAARTYGSTYTSGLLSYGGGDSQGLIERELIDKLLRRGEDI